MKKLVMTVAIVLGLCMTSFADPNGGGLFQRGATNDEGGFRETVLPSLPNHDAEGNQDGNSPLGSGVVVLLGLGAAYLVGKKHNEE